MLPISKLALVNTFFLDTRALSQALQLPLGLTPEQLQIRGIILIVKGFRGQKGERRTVL